MDCSLGKELMPLSNHGDISICKRLNIAEIRIVKNGTALSISFEIHSYSAN